MADSPQSKSKRKKLPIGQVLLIGAAFLVGFIILGAAATIGWDYSNSVGFCSNLCHFVHPEEPAAYQDSYHASVKCTECHMGRLGTLQSIVVKASHFRHLPEVLFSHWSRPLLAKTMRPANESCEKCHYPPAFHGDRVATIAHFASDEQNTGERIYLLLKTGGGERSLGLGIGIHWHIENKVEYIAMDEEKQDIRWIRSTFPDGSVVEYSDSAQPLSADEISKAVVRTMDCVDCHNRVGHPFPSPDSAVDQAIDEGLISRDLPYVKERMVSLLSASYPTQEAAIAAVNGLAEAYSTEFPEVAATQAAAIAQAQQTAADLVTRVVFQDPTVTWRSFPDNGQHKDFPGCFRCHDGKHLSAAGDSVRLQCNICHSVPVTIGYADRPPQLPVGTVQEPASHSSTTFIADHRFLANDSCAECHGPVTFGADDSNFCANSACHGRAWPQVNLNAAFPHPIPLVGKHAQVWCFSCHQGVKKPVYLCSNCHQPPADHFTQNCADCHDPTDWVGSASALLAAPAITHPLAGREDCLVCHDPAGNVRPAPATHKDFTVTQCTICHKTSSVETAAPTATPAAAATPTPAPTVAPTNTAAPGSTAAPTAAATATTVTAATATTAAPSGVAGAPPIPHTLVGRDACMTCHDPAGNIKPAPADHAGRDVTLCVTCHTPPA